MAFLITLSENSTDCTLCELFKTKQERNCNQLFHNRLKYLKCPQTHAVFYVCLLLFMDLWKTKQPCAVYLFTVLTRPVSCLLVAYLRSVLWCLHSFCISLFPLHLLIVSFQNRDQFIWICPCLSKPSSLHLHPFPCLFISAVVSPVEGQWLEWGPWSRCSVTCNTGTQQRQRRCSSSVHGWAECKGPHQESRDCANPSCSGTAHKWMLSIHTHALKGHHANMETCITWKSSLHIAAVCGLGHGLACQFVLGPAGRTY